MPAEPESADKSINASNAAESAASEKAGKAEEGSGPATVDEGDPKSTNDGSGTSETD